MKGTIIDIEELFWSIAEDLLSSRVEEGTMMGTRCLRVDGNFAAMVARQDWGLVVKLSADRVQELIAEGVGEPFAPAKKVFREWVSIPQPDESLWRALMKEAVG
ncbi:MAG TPA: hypothetical protein ENH15_00155 [Actinobacteria bacterium]|nr:hypothetical protein [Actinomycetota bacterium]